MKNIINYYYSFNIINIFIVNKGYFFNYNDNSYMFVKLERPIDELNSIYNLYKELKTKKIFVNDIILNRDNQIISNVDNVPYVLIRDNTKNNMLSINDILYYQNNTLMITNDRKLFRNDWIKLWVKKLDYYENNSKLSKKYSKLNESIDYYIGLGENAISYLVNNYTSTNDIVLSHKRIKASSSSFDFYNPLNFILDSRVRDFSEYIKELFFKNRISFDEFKRCIDYMNFNKNEYILLIARLLFPTYYFDLYDLIINEEKKEDVIKNVLSKKNAYNIFLKNTFYYIVYTKKINIPFIEWIVKS